jgi:hypothetical protein
MHSPLPKSSVMPSLRKPTALKPKSIALKKRSPGSKNSSAFKYSSTSKYSPPPANPPSAAPAPAPKTTLPAEMALRPEDRRRTRRRMINRMAKIQFGASAAQRDCVIGDISAGGVRLQVEGFQVPDAFVLFVNADGVTRECVYRVVWRLGSEIGAAFVRFVKRSGVSVVVR